MTATVLLWPKHKMTSYDTLGGCLVCQAWEGEMPQDCPGRKMTTEEKEAVMCGELDFFRREGWSTFTRAKRIRVRLYCEEGRPL